MHCHWRALKDFSGLEWHGSRLCIQTFKAYSRLQTLEFRTHLPCRWECSARIKPNPLPQVTVANKLKRKNPKVLGNLRLSELTGLLVKVNEQRGRIGSGKLLPVIVRDMFQGNRSEDQLCLPTLSHRDQKTKQNWPRSKTAQGSLCLKQNLLKVETTLNKWGLVQYAQLQKQNIYTEALCHSLLLPCNSYFSNPMICLRFSFPCKTPYWTPCSSLCNCISKSSRLPHQCLPRHCLKAGILLQSQGFSLRESL